jgi:hypothetical protein
MQKLYKTLDSSLMCLKPLGRKGLLENLAGVLSGNDLNRTYIH